MNELKFDELQEINGGGWPSVIGGGLIIAGGFVSGGTIPIATGLITGLGTMIAGA